MVSRLTWADRALLALLPLHLVVVSLHVDEVARSGLGQIPIYAVPSERPGGYPRVGGFRLETPGERLELAPGDRLLRVGGRDLRGVGFIGFEAIALAEARATGETSVTVERNGVSRTLRLPAHPHPHPWSRLPLLLLMPLVCTLILLRAPGSPTAQRFYAAFVVYALVQAQFYGGPEWKTWASLLLWNAGAPTAAFLMLRWATQFPVELPAERRARPIWAWAGAGALVVVRASYATGSPIPPEWVQRVSHAVHAGIMLGTLALLAHNYAHAGAVGRRRLKWVLYGAVLGAAPLTAVLVVPLVAPDWQGFGASFALGNLATIAWVLGTVIAIARYNAFDIDRLIGATASYTLVAVGFVAALLAGIPPTAHTAAQLLGVNPQTAQVALSMALAALVVPMARRVRPVVDRIFFPERVALERGMRELMERISRCALPSEVLERMAAGARALLNPDAHVLYARAGDRLVRTSADRELAPAVLEARPPSALAHPGVQLLPRSTHGDALVDRLREIGLVLAVPVRGDGLPSGLLLLGRKRSGDIYTPTDLALLGALADRTASELLRLRHAEDFRQQRERVLLAESETQRAIQSELDKSRFLAVASHDLRQPLHALGFFVERLEARGRSAPSGELVDQIRRSTDDLREMITSLLDLSKLEAGTLEVVPAVFSLAPLLERVEAELSPEARAKGIRLRIVPTAVCVRSDRLLLSRILRNLVANAIRYTQHGSVLVGCRRRGGELQLCVTDTGPGIAPAQQQRIFDEFTQASPHPPGEGVGLGLGLFIVDRLARLLAHPIAVRSEPGRGSTFSVMVPRARGVREFTRGGDGSPTATPLRGLRVGVVDDDEAVRDATRDLAASWGCDVRTASGLDDAREHLIAPDWIPAILLADHQLAGEEVGPAVIEAVRREAGREIPAVLITGDTSPDGLARLRKSGHPVLVKPLAPAGLRAVLSQAARRRP